MKILVVYFFLLFIPNIIFAAAGLHYPSDSTSICIDSSSTVSCNDDYNKKLKELERDYNGCVHSLVKYPETEQWYRDCAFSFLMRLKELHKKYPLSAEAAYYFGNTFIALHQIDSAFTYYDTAQVLYAQSDKNYSFGRLPKGTIKYITGLRSEIWKTNINSASDFRLNEIDVLQMLNSDSLKDRTKELSVILDRNRSKLYRKLEYAIKTIPMNRSLDLRNLQIYIEEAIELLESSDDTNPWRYFLLGSLYTRLKMYNKAQKPLQLFIDSDIVSTHHKNQARDLLEFCLGKGS